MLGKVEVLLSNENALCGDRVSASPCMQHKSHEKMYFCHSHGAGKILTAEEVPGNNVSARSIELYIVHSGVEAHVQAKFHAKLLMAMAGSACACGITDS